MQQGVTIVLNTAPAAELPAEVLKKLDIVTPNETEAQILTGVKIENGDDAKKAAEVLMEKGVKQVVITLGSMGAFAMNSEKSELVERLSVDAIDTTGAETRFTAARHGAGRGKGSVHGPALWQCDGSAFSNQEGPPRPPCGSGSHRQIICRSLRLTERSFIWKDILWE